MQDRKRQDRKDKKLFINIYSYLFYPAVYDPAYLVKTVPAHLRFRSHSKHVRSLFQYLGIGESSQVLLWL
jgi:hypothetical protein